MESITTYRKEYENGIYTRKSNFDEWFYEKYMKILRNVERNGYVSIPYNRWKMETFCSLYGLKTPAKLDKKIDMNAEVEKYLSEVYSEKDSGKYEFMYYDKYLIAIRELKQRRRLRYETWEDWHKQYPELDKHTMRNFMKKHKLMNPRIMADKVMGIKGYYDGPRE